MLGLAQEEHEGLRSTGERLHAADRSRCDADRVDWDGVRIDVDTAVLLARARGAEVG